MDMNPVNPTETSTGPATATESISVSGIDTTTHKVFGVPRRAIAFGFVLFVLFVVLAVVYSQFASRNAMTPTADKVLTETAVPVGALDNNKMPVVGPVTPDTVTNDLIDEATADRDATDAYTDDEMADVQDGSNY